MREDPRIRDLAVMLNPTSAAASTSASSRAQQHRLRQRLRRHRERELKRRPDLHAVVNILLLHQITGEMYLTRNRRKVLFIDELKQQLGDIGADDPVEGGRGRGSRASRPQVRRIARHGHAECRRLLRIGPDGGGLQLLGLGVPAAAEARVDRDARPQGAAVDGRAQEAAAQLAAHGAGRVLGGLASPRRWAKAWRGTSSTRRPTCCSPTSWRTTPDRRLRAQGLSIDDAITELRRRGHAV